MIEMHVIVTADTVVSDLIIFAFVLLFFKEFLFSNLYLQILSSLHVEIGHKVDACVYALNNNVISLLEPCAAKFFSSIQTQNKDVHKKAHRRR